MLIHIEIQGYKQEIFPERMFDYYCRLRPKAKKENKDLICLCLFIVNDKSYKPNKFLYKFEDFKIEFIYPAVNIYELKKRALEYIEKGIKNIYVYITLMAIESFKIEKKIKRKNKEEILKEFIDEFAIPFIKRLLKEGFKEEEIRCAFYFIGKFFFAKIEERDKLKERVRDVFGGGKMSAFLEAIEELIAEEIEKRAQKLAEEKARKLAEEKTKTFVIKMYKKGVDINTISELMEISKDIINKWLKEEGLI